MGLSFQGVSLDNKEHLKSSQGTKLSLARYQFFNIITRVVPVANNLLKYHAYLEQKGVSEQNNLK